MNLNNPELRTDTPWAFIVSLLMKVLSQSRLKANWVTQKWKARRKDNMDEGDDWGRWERSRRERASFLAAIPKPWLLFSSSQSVASPILCVLPITCWRHLWNPRSSLSKTDAQEKELFLSASCQVLHLLVCWDEFLSWVLDGQCLIIKVKDEHTASTICVLAPSGYKCQCLCVPSDKHW